MKRFICVLMVLSMLPLYALSEFKDLTDEELKSMYDSVRDEMISRGLFKEAQLPSGAYYAGSFLPEGTYVCTLESGGGAVYTYKSYDSFLKGEEELSRVFLRSNDSFTMMLQGETCYVFEKTTTVRPGGLVW